MSAAAWAEGFQARRDAERAERLNSARYCVYRLHDERGETLYIGMTGDLRLRIQKHEREAAKKATKAAWFYRTRSVTLAGPFTWRDATAREREEIRIVQPVGNIAHTERDHRPAVASRVAWLNAKGQA